MPKRSYGPEAKKRVVYLFTTLLDYANDELDVGNNQLWERQLERLRSHITIHWEGDRHLIIRTKIRHLETLTQLMPEEITLTSAQIKDGFKYLEQFLGILEDNRTSRRGSDTWHFTLSLWHSRWDREQNLQAFEQHWANRREERQEKRQISRRGEQQDKRRSLPAKKGDSSTSTLPQPLMLPGTDHWSQRCRQYLDQRHHTQLTTNPLMVHDGLTFTMTDLYIPLNLVKRQPLLLESSSFASNSALDSTLSGSGGRGRDGTTAEGEDEDKSFLPSHDFFAQIFQAASTPSEQRVAIVGEPGAGKTTLLQQFAQWLLNHTKALPIWISLADLGEQSLETHITQSWLRHSIGQLAIPPDTLDDFAQQVKQGRIWLLLDAIDEMALPASMALTQLSKQITGWLAHTHIVLTCRQNVWDSGKNALGTFTTYSCCNFSDGQQKRPDQLRAFINRWFQRTPELGHQLRQELQRPDLKHIKDTVTNPLRLALLCRIWTLRQGQLPTTKAQLYQQFVDAIYTWKQDYFPISLVQRHGLNQALSDLALTAMVAEQPRFRLPQSFVHQVFQRHDLALLELALQLGWLNHIGQSVETHEPVYAFYHATFQDYFASLAITSWDAPFSIRLR